MRWVIVAFISLASCRGEQVGDPVEPDSATDSGSATADSRAETEDSRPGTEDTAVTETLLTDAGCPTGTMNLLLNGEFESWSGPAPDNWDVNTSVISVEQQSEDAGTKFARVTIKAYGNGIYQTINLPEPLPKGCKIKLTARSRYVSGPNTPTPDLFMYLFDSAGMGPSGTGSSFPSYSATWSTHTAVFTADRTVTKVQAYVLGNAMGGTQVFDLDDAVVTYVP